MKVISKQRNSRMCLICGLDNPIGVQAPFYNIEDGTVMSRFRSSENHQSYPGRVHGGMITAMLDEMGLRAVWAKYGGCEDCFGVTINLSTNFRKPVPYHELLYARGELIRDARRYTIVHAGIYTPDGMLLADGELKYLKLDPSEIAADAAVHEEMPYLIEDGVAEIDWLGKDSI